MLPLDSYVKEILSRAGFPDAPVAADLEVRKGAVTIDIELNQAQLQEFVEALNHLVARYAEKNKAGAVFFDINGYRAAREELIVRLAKAAADKALRGGARVELPSMNSYERRLVHAHIGDIPGVQSESTGLGRERRVTISPKED